MAAGLGFKTFNTGEVLTSADVNGYLMQGVLVFASEAARNAAITSPQEGQFAYTKDTNSLWYYTGSAWAASGATGDIEGVTAGTGISGGGTSGTVTITNSMATEITAKGDLIVGTGNAAFDNLAVGTNGHVLTADSTVSPTGLKWAAPAGGGKVLQVVQGTTTTRMQTTSTSYVDTNLSQAITPSSATSKVLVLVFQNIHLSRSGTDAACQYKLVRTSTALSEYYLSVYNSTGGDAEIRQMGVFSYLDSPATTSATTYKTQIRSGNASTTSDVQENASSLAAIVLLEIGA
jgi:hypothetical protein